MQHVRRRGRLPAGLIVGLGLVVALARPELSPAQRAPRLFVLASVDLSGRVLGRELEAALSPMRVSVFGRLHDFTRAVREGAPEAVLARRALLEQYHLATHIQGYADHQDREPFVLVSRGAPLAVADLASATVGVVDLLGPQQMPALAQRLLSGVRPAVLRRVTKPADLGALLRLDLAQAVLVPRRHVSALQAGSEMPLRVTELEQGAVGLYAVHAPEPALRARLLSQLNRLGGGLKQLLGVDEWR